MFVMWLSRKKDFLSTFEALKFSSQILPANIGIRFGVQATTHNPLHISKDIERFKDFETT